MQSYWCKSKQTRKTVSSFRFFHNIFIISFFFKTLAYNIIDTIIVSKSYCFVEVEGVKLMQSTVTIFINSYKDCDAVFSRLQELFL